MKKVLLLLLTAVLFLPLTMRAQLQPLTLTVADGTETNSYVPIYGYYCDSYLKCEYVFPASDLSLMSGYDITGMTFYLSQTAAASWGSANFQVFLAEVSSTAISSYYGTDNAQIVYTGSLDGTASTMQVTFDSAYTYQGGNLLVGFYNTVTGNWKSANFYGINSTGSCVQGYSGTSLDNVSAGQKNFLPKTTFNYLGVPPSCPDVENVTATNVTDNSADITWTSVETETNFDIYVADSLTDVPTATTTPTATATTNTYSMTDLESSTYYYVYVRANCGAGDVSNWKGVTFLTSQIPAELPYTQDFEDENENANWTILDPSTNKWVIGSAVNTTSEGENALYVSNNNGVSNAYTTSSTSISWAYRDIDFGTDYAQYGISFNYRVAGESPAWDIMRVFIGDPAVPSTSSYDAPTGAMLLGTFVSQSEWTSTTLLLNNTLAQGVKRLYFLWKNDASGGSNPPAAVDDIAITGISCARPTAVTIDSVTTETLTFHFSPATENDNAWQAMLISANDTIIEDLTDTTYTFEELNHSTNYTLMVRTDCGEEYSYWTIGVSAATDCAPQSVPYTENFNGSVNCWSGNVDADYYSLSIYDQALSMYVSQYSYTEGYLMGITPELDNEVALNTLSLSFRYKWSAYYDYYTYNLIVGTVASPDSAAATFTPIATYTYDADHDNEWLTVEDLALTNAGTDHHYIAFKLLTDYSITAYIDDIEVALPATCARPSNFVSTGNTATTISLSWTAGGEETAWNVAYGPAGFIPTEETTGETVYTTSMTVEELTTGTAYDFYVQADCGGETSTWRGPLTVIPGSFTFGTTGSDTLTGCGYTLYDNGGPTGNYSTNCNYTLVIYPENEGEFVQVSGTFDIEAGYDYLTIFDGIGTTGSQLWKTSTNYSDPNQGVVPAINSTTGPLTIKFTSDSWDASNSGFVLNQTCITCVAPIPVAPIVGANMATITWPIVGTQDAWQVVYGPEGFNPDSATTAEDVVDNIYLITELIGNTRYDFYLRTNCDGEYSAWSNVLQFTTLSDSPATTPYCHDWSNAEENSQWVIMNGNQTNKWYIGQPTGESDSVLFISSNGVSESYETGSSSIVWAFRDIHFGEGAEFNLNIKWKGYGESTYDYMRIFIGSQSAVVTPGDLYPQGVTQLAQLNQQSNWQMFSTNLDASYANTDQRLFFLWRNDGSAGSNPPAVIDSITITVGDCGAPYNLTVENLNPTSADLTFTPAMSADDAWQIVFGTNIIVPDSAMPVTVTDTVLELDTLAENTSYTFFVRTVCGDEEYSAWSSAFTFSTPCASGIDSLPFAENFDNIASYAIPDCWYRNSTYAEDYPVARTYNSYSQPNNMYFVADDESYSMLILPKVDDQIQVNTLQVSFMYDASYESDYMMVGVMTDPLDASTFVAVGTVYPNLEEPDTWEERIVSLATYEGNGRYIAFKNGTTQTYGNGSIDDLVVDVIPSCPKPMSFVVNAVTTTSVTLQWNEMGEADTWEIVYGEPGFDPDTATTTVSAGTNPFEVTDLQDGTIYEFYVRAACSAIESSEWATPVTAATECLNYSMPFSEDFNATTGSNIPVCWDNSNIADDYVYWQTSNDGYQSSRCAYYLGWGGYSASLMTPKVELTDDAMVSFMYKMGSTSVPGTTKVYVSTDGGATKTAIESDLQKLDTWTSVWYDLSDYTGDTVNIIFESRGTSWSNYYVYVDNVTIEELPTCFAPVNVIASNATENSIAIAWTPYGDESSWNIHYREVGTDTWIDVPSAVSDTFYTVTGLNASTSYEFQVQAVCGVGDVSGWSQSAMAATLCLTFTTFPYTQGFENGGNMPICWSQEYVSGSIDWSFKAGGNSSGSITTAHTGNYNACFFYGSSSPNYQTKLVSPVFDLTQLSNPYVSFWHAQQNWSSDQDHLTVYYRTSSSSEWTELIAYTSAITAWTFDSLALPNPSATYQLAFEGYSSYGHGVVLDDITIDGAGGPTPPTPGDTCLTPTAVAASNETYNSASINWTAGGDETAWNLQYKKATDAAWSNSIAVTTRPYTLSGLDAETAYNVRVQANCGEGETSEWSTVADFTTTAVPAEPCDDPTDLTVGNITARTAVATWTAGGDETVWNIQYKLSSESAWNSYTSSTPSYTLEGLTPQSEYTIQVQANCGEGNVSGWVSTTFTTLVDGISSVELANSISIMPNPAESYIELSINSNVSVKEAAIYNAFGQMIQKVTLTDNHARIDVSGMAAGMYFVRIADDNNMATKKFIKK